MPKWTIVYKATMFCEDEVEADTQEEALKKWGDGDSEARGVVDQDLDSECELVSVEIV